MTAKNLALATITATGTTASRSFGDRAAEIFNVKDYGAIGNGSHDDTSAINAALLAMWQSTYKGAILFFPPGNYIVTSAIDIGNHEAGSNYTNGIIMGSGKYSTYINGTLNNDFVFYQNDEVNGPGEICHLSLVNSSTWIGSGALRMSNSGCVFNDLNLQGMISCLLPYNIYNAAFNNCIGRANSDATTGYNGTLGIAGMACDIKNWRTTNPYMTCLQLWGSNSSVLSGNGIENCVTAVLLGANTSWANSCTVSGTTLTIGGTIGTTGVAQFVAGMTVFGRGIDLPNWGQDPNDTTGGTTIVSQLSGTAGFAGTYQLSKSFTISTPIPIWFYSSQAISGCAVNGLQSEACFHELYLNSVGTSNINAAGGGATPIECPNQFGTTGLTARCNIYVKSASATTLSGCTASAGGYMGGIVIDPNAGVTNVTFVSCDSEKRANNAVTATVSNGSGGAGTVLNVTAFTSGSGIGVGMAVTGAGISAGTVITGNHLTDPTLTGTITTGTYRVNNSQNIASEAMTVVTGEAWVMPTATSSKAGLKFVNCGAANLPAGATSGLETLSMTFTCLPGQAGASTNVALIEGQQFDITDGAKSGGGTAALGDNVQGGGSQHLLVRYNGTNWTAVGK